MDASIGVNLLPGTLCVAAEDYRVGKETENGEISFLKGDILTIVSHSPEGSFCQVTTVDGSSGEIPLTLLADRPAIPLQPLPWFHGNISRAEAEELLQVEERGQFLLRTSQNTDGVCALAVSTGSEIKHYLIAMNKTTGRLSLDGERYFGSLSQLVQFYMAKEKQCSHFKQELPGPVEEKRPESPPLSQPVEAKGMLAFDADWRTMNQKWGIKSENIEIVRLIGKGEFGDVNAGVYKGLQVALKSLSDSSENHSTASRSFLQEAAVMTHLQHKNLVQLLGVVFSGSTLKGIVMELMVKGSVVKYLSSRGRSVVSQAELLQIARHVCEGMLYITSQGFVHRDLAARNVLLDGSGQAKVSDFGLARRADIHVPNEGGKFPVKWTAPESMKESIFSERSDVWSFGIFLWEIYSFGRTPYPSILSEKVLEFLEDGDVMDCPDGCPEGIYDIMVQCWEMEPSLRPTFRSLQSLLAKSFGESWTPCSSPMVSRRSIIRVSEEVEGLVGSPVASDIYREAPDKDAAIHVTNILLVGAEGSGKTSLSRCFQGKQFRIKEAPTLCLDLPLNYSELVGHRDWLATSVGLSYERELVRIIAAELLKSIRPPSPSPSPVSTMAVFPLTVSHLAPPPLPTLASHPAYFSHPNLPQESSSSSPVPQLPPTRKKRAASLNVGNNTTTVFPSSQRYSMNLEAYREKSPIGIPTSGSHPEGLSAIQNGASPSSHRRRIHIPRKFSLSKWFGAHRKSSKGSKPDPTSAAAPGLPSFLNRRNSSPTDVPLAAARTSPPLCKRSLSVPEKFSSALPEQLEVKVKEKLKDCVAGTIPAEVYGRIVDLPSSGAITALEPMLLTDSALVLAVLDVSKQLGQAGFQNGLTSSRPSSPMMVAANQLLTQLMVVSEKWLADKRSESSPSRQIILVGTHTDKISPSEARSNYDAARRMLQSSSCGRFLSSAAFLVSCSSTIDRGGLEEFKRYIVDTVKKHGQEEVPLRWMRCIRRFQGLAKAGQYLLSEGDCREIIRELCALKEESEVRDVMHFLNRHLILLHFPGSHSQQSVVVTDPAWFYTQIGNLFTVHHSSEAALPQELAGDLATLRSKGALSDKLLDHVWHFSTFEKRELLQMLAVLDLVFLLGKDSQPLLPRILDTGRSNSLQVDKRPPSSSPIITAVIIPSLVQVPCPASVSHPATTEVEPLYFAFRWGVLPSGFFPRLVVRCMHKYSSTGYSLYQDAACFFIGADVALVLQACPDSVRVTLQPTPSAHLSSPSSPAHLESSLPELAMVARMFLQASVADIMQRWLPNLCCDPCFPCHCMPGHTHYTAIGNVDSFTNHVAVKCQLNNHASLPPTAAPWFGEELKVQQAPFDDDEADQYVSTEDIALVAQSLQESFATLGSAMGFSDEEIVQFSQQGDSSAHSATEQMLQEWCHLNLQNASFLDLVSSLENIGRVDVANNLIDSKMKSSGVAL